MIVILALPGSASAHAVLESSSPTRGQVLQHAPAKVTFEFNEPVEASFGALRVFDVEGEQVQSGDVFRPDDRDNGIGVALPGDLADGTYTATYRAVSADAHPVSGGLVFTVGKAGGVSGKTISELIAESDSGPVTGVAFWFDRWIGFLAIALAVGSLAFLVLLWMPILSGREESLGPRAVDTGRRLRLVLGISVAAGFLATIFAIPFQGAIAAGTDFWSAFKPDVFREVVDTRFGMVMVLRLLSWVCLIPLVVLATRLALPDARRYAPTILFSIITAAFLIISPGLAGHASTQSPVWLLFPSDVLHVAAMSVWAGGLAALIFLLPVTTRGLTSGEDRTSTLTDFLLRFSTIALVCVIVIAATGTIQSIVEVNSLTAFLDTAFGRAVLIKIVLFLALVGLGAKNRRRIIPALVERRDRKEAPGGPGVRIRNNLRIEVVLVTVVLAVTAALVSYPPPTTEGAGPVSGSMEVGADLLEYTVDPAKVGNNEVHIYLFDNETGAPVNIRSLGLSFSLPDSDIASIEADVRKSGPGHYVAPAAELAVKGKWRAEAAVRFSRFEDEIAEFEVPVK
ncbi:MAG: CopD family protein [Solirubrobacterales bacterium]|nr:CopD family protein [Solirubrobacterales bacterium]